MMKLTFCGAAGTVTGSCHLLQVNGRSILIDCGLKQGRDEGENDQLPFVPGDIDYVIVTHAHIDHSGRLPLLAKEGFAGQIITTRLTAQLLGIMLMDSAHIQESDAAWENQKGRRAGREPVEPLYTREDAARCLELVQTYDYGQAVQVCPGVSLTFADAGHLLGSAFVRLTLEEEGEGVTKTIVFSGDIGNKEQPIIRDPQTIAKADYVVTESTYGDRDHQREADYTEAFAEILEETFAKNGNVVIPSFAVGRTQELLYKIREIKERGLVPSYPDFDVYVDSPLAKAATEIYSGDLTGYLDEEAMALVADGIKMFSFPGLHLCESAEESRALNTDKTPKVIISASGMCDAGRIRHHLKHNLWRPESTVVFVGFQVEGSFGRHLLDGAKQVRLFGEEIVVRSRMVNFKGLSGHADRSGLLEWIDGFDPKPQHVFVVHGDTAVIDAYTQTLRDRGFAAHAPLYTEEYDLAADSISKTGIIPVRKKPVAAPARDSALYLKLLAAAQRLLEVVQRNRGGANKDLRKFTEQITALIHKWDR